MPLSTKSNGDIINEDDWNGIINAVNDLNTLVDTLSGSIVPPGCIMPWGTSSAPTGWLLCDGSSVLRATYPDLFAAIGTTFGSADGTHFTLPDFRGRTLVGAGAGSGLTARTLAATVGAETVTLSTAEIPSHNHTQDAHTHTQNSHNHTQDAHGHTQDAHSHTQNSHNHTQDAHNHTQDAHHHTYDTFIGGGIGSDYPAGATAGTFGTLDTGDTAATNQAATATNQAATATNQNTTATNQNTTATNQAATATNQNTTATNQATGGGGAHANMQPSLVVSMIIKT